MTNEMRSRIFAPVNLCILALCMIFRTSNSYGAKNDESAKCFFAEGHKIVIDGHYGAGSCRSSGSYGW